jgi:hypothetical protein
MEISIVTPPGQSGSFTIGSRERGRSPEDLPERHLKLLDEPVTAGMARVNGNRTIHTSPVWVSRHQAEILLNSVRGRQKDRNLRLRRAPRVSAVRDFSDGWMPPASFHAACAWRASPARKRLRAACSSAWVGP